jgi:gas vesicle protein
MEDEEMQDELPSEREFDTTSFLTGILVGAAVGAGVALLFAPASGSDTRRLIRRRARSLEKDASRGFASARDEARRTFKEKKEYLRERLAQGLDTIQDELGV